VHPRRTSNETGVQDERSDKAREVETCEKDTTPRGLNSLGIFRLATFEVMADANTTDNIQGATPNPVQDVDVCAAGWRVEGDLVAEDFDEPVCSVVDVAVHFLDVLVGEDWRKHDTLLLVLIADSPSQSSSQDTFLEGSDSGRDRVLVRFLGENVRDRCRVGGYELNDRETVSGRALVWCT
jgi:hypothetical protein